MLLLVDVLIFVCLLAYAGWLAKAHARCNARERAVKAKQMHLLLIEGAVMASGKRLSEEARRAVALCQDTLLQYGKRVAEAVSTIDAETGRRLMADAQKASAELEVKRELDRHKLH